MEKVLIVCGAGASSTFLALRLRGVARARGLDLTIEAAPLADLDERLAATDVLLLGPHLAWRFDELDDRASASGVRLALLPETVFGPEGAERAVELIEELLENARSSVTGSRQSRTKEIENG